MINALIQNRYTPIIASDGDALHLLRKEFPNLKYLELPSYNINYSRDGVSLKYKMLLNAPKIMRASTSEKSIVHKIIDKEGISGIISDNRFGVRSKKVPSIYITHQLNVFSGNTSFLTSLTHQKIISKFDSCWIPDYKGNISLAGKLSNLEHSKLNIKYLGPISRFSYEESPKKNDLLIILSGPEPQRSLLEKMLTAELKNNNKRILFVRGVLSEKQEVSQTKNIKTVNYMLFGELQAAINESELVLARSGFSTIMDLEKLMAKAFFIPTPGQYEQEYLAEYLEQKKIAPYANQQNFKIEMIDRIKQYTGFEKKEVTGKINFKKLFDLEFS